MLDPTSKPTVPNDEKPLGGDFFSSLGTEHRPKETPKRPDPDAVCSLQAFN